MKLVQISAALLATALLSNATLAGVYKCTNNQGNTSYQSSPCAQESNGLEIDMKTGGLTDLSFKQKKIQDDIEFKKRQEAKRQQLIKLEAKRLKDAAEQSDINQQLVRNNTIQFSAFAIPPYQANRLPKLVKQYEARLPAIEKFRRLAAQKALATGKCLRVESDELSIQSKIDHLVFSVNCSSARTFNYSEKELGN